MNITRSPIQKDKINKKKTNFKAILSGIELYFQKKIQKI